MTWRKDFERGEARLTVAVEALGDERYVVTVGDVRHEVVAHRLPDGRIAFRRSGSSDGTLVAAVALGDAAGETMVRIGGRTHTLRAHRGRGRGAAGGSGVVLAPMTGTVLDVTVAVGDRVSVGAVVAVVSAMKMEHRLVADLDGIVVAIGAAVGGQVERGAVLARIEASAVD